MMLLLSGMSMVCHKCKTETLVLHQCAKILKFCALPHQRSSVLCLQHFSCSPVENYQKMSQLRTEECLTISMQLLYLHFERFSEKPLQVAK